MLKMAKLIGYLVVALLFTPGESAPPTKCTQTEDDFDNCASHVTTFGNDDMIIPTNDAELDQHCNKTFESIQCLRVYARNCMVNFPKTVFGVFQYDFKRDLKKRCQTKEGRAEFIKHMSCGAQKGGFGPIHQCIRNYDAQLEWIISSLAKEQKVVASCCALHWTHQCVVSKIDEMCKSVTGPETSEYFDKMVSSTIAEGVDYTCDVHKSFADCEAHLDAKTWQMLKDIGEDPSKTNFVPRHKSPITTAIKMFSALDSGA